ncbi:ABC transporter permease [Roseateles sp. BYS180W]|uniref:ABC transporter permease n=1 Tax=Roseateles rivi TaxID=3299028 RepID=A0ABW7FUT6_9BURK
MPVWRQALQQARQDARAPELHLLLLALALAVCAVCAVAFLADRLQAGLSRDAAQLLGGDAVLTSDQPTPEPLRQLAQELRLRTAHSTSFPSMVRAPDAAGGDSRLAAVKAVDTAYPLRGKLTLQDGRQAVAPAAGQVWVDAAVLDSLQLRVGQTLWLGERELAIAGVLQHEPDRGAGFMNFAPRVMMAHSDLASTGLIQPASRVNYRMAVVGDRAADVAQFVARAQAQIKTQGWRGVRLESLESGRPEMRQTLDRAASFLNLVALLAALMAAVAVALSARGFAQHRLDACALLRVLGQTQRRLAWAYALEFLGLGLAASLVGVGLGWLLHWGFVAVLGALLQADLPGASWWPVALGLGMGGALLVGFGLPPVLQLAAVPPLRVIRRELGTPRSGAVLAGLAGALGFTAVLVILAKEPRVGLMAALGFGAALLVFALVAWGALKLLRVAVPLARAPRWLLLATRQLGARPALVVTQVAALSFGLLALALLVWLRTDLIDSWRAATPVDAPDRFVINIQPEQLQPFEAALQQAGVARHDAYPMLRGRLVSINGKAVKPEQFSQDRAQRLVEREFNLSHAADLPANNQVVGGRWGQPQEAGALPKLSVEQGLAQQLGLHLGDTLSFDVAGALTQGQISSIRKVDWASMRVNFFVMFEQAPAQPLPQTFIAAYRSPKGLDRQLMQQFPNLTIVDVSAQISQLQQVLNQIVLAVQLLFGVALVLGVLVLVIAATSSREARAREYALLRALGAQAALLRAMQRAELLGLGALAGLLAGLCAQGLAWVLTQQVFEFEWTPRPWLVLGCVLTGAALAQLAGWWGLRGVLKRPVVHTLRSALQE